jgi:uncharacterized membrane protein
MREWLTVFTEHAVVVVDAMAAVIIVVGSIEAFVLGLLSYPKPTHVKREIWLRYARWLIAGMTFQLAADILETSVAMTWQALAQLAIVAVVRTFLNYFLERDVTDAREKQRNPLSAPQATRVTENQ